MVTDPGTFFQKKLIRPCLDLNLQTQRTWSEHFTTELSISPLCSLTEQNEIFVLTWTLGVSSMCLPVSRLWLHAFKDCHEIWNIKPWYLGRLELIRLEYKTYSELFPQKNHILFRIKLPLLLLNNSFKICQSHPFKKYSSPILLKSSLQDHIFCTFENRTFCNKLDGIINCRSKNCLSPKCTT